MPVAEHESAQLAAAPAGPALPLAQPAPSGRRGPRYPFRPLGSAGRAIGLATKHSRGSERPGAVARLRNRPGAVVRPSAPGRPVCRGSERQRRPTLTIASPPRRTRAALGLRPDDSCTSTDPVIAIGGVGSVSRCRLVGRSAYRAVRGPGLNLPLFPISDSWRSAVALTQSQLVSAVAERAELSKNDAKRALAALDEIVLEELGNAQKVRIGGLVQLTVRVKPAQKARRDVTQPRARRSRSRPSQRASICARAHSRGRRVHCRRCRRRVDGSRPKRRRTPSGTARPRQSPACRAAQELGAGDVLVATEKRDGRDSCDWFGARACRARVGCSLTP